MAISLSFSLKDLESELTADEAQQVAQGGLDGDQVWYQYLTMEDDRVRPSHAALQGTYWRADDPDAPTPPLDYGCRCFIRYVAAPESVAANILPEADGALSSRVDAFRSYLDDNLDGWKTLATEARKLKPVDRLEYLIHGLVDEGLTTGNLARDIAFMILSVL